MSNYVSAIVYRKKVGSAVRKAVLAYCADKASDDGRGVWASKGTIAAQTECARSTVIKTIKDFVAEGLLVVVGERTCLNGATVEYDINLDVLADLPDAENTIQKPVRRADPSAQRTRPTDDPSAQRTPPVRQAEGYPSASRTQTILKPSLNHPSSNRRASDEVAETLERFASPDAVASFIAYRKRQKKALTATAAKRLAGSLQVILNAGHDPSDALALAEERGWASVQPDWYFKSKEVACDQRHHEPRQNARNAGGSGPHARLYAAFARAADRDGSGGF